MVGDSLLIVTDRAYVVPRAGGPVRALDDAGGSLIGLDDTGMLGYRVMSGDRFSPYRAPIDGSPAQPFWTAGRAAHFRPWLAMPDGTGGWVITGHEPFDDGALHVSLWWLDAQENGTPDTLATRARRPPGAPLTTTSREP